MSLFLDRAFQLFASSIRARVIVDAVDNAMLESAQADLGIEPGSEPSRAGSLEARTPRAGSQASTKAVLRRQARFGESKLSNETKIKMKEQGQNVG